MTQKGDIFTGFMVERNAAYCNGSLYIHKLRIYTLHELWDSLDYWLELTVSCCFPLEHFILIPFKSYALVLTLTRLMFYSNIYTNYSKIVMQEEINFGYVSQKEFPIYTLPRSTL